MVEFRTKHGDKFFVADISLSLCHLKLILGSMTTFWKLLGIHILPVDGDPGQLLPHRCFTRHPPFRFLSRLSAQLAERGGALPKQKAEKYGVSVIRSLSVLFSFPSDLFGGIFISLIDFHQMGQSKSTNPHKLKNITKQ